MSAIPSIATHQKSLSHSGQNIRTIIAGFVSVQPWIQPYIAVALLVANAQSVLREASAGPTVNLMAGATDTSCETVGAPD